MTANLELILAAPRGFCAGVDRAITIVEEALALYGPPVYVRHEIVHNKFVVQKLRDKGAIFVDELAEIPDHAVTIFSAHGVAEVIENEAINRGLTVVDATCPLVTKVHLEAQRNEREGKQIVLIGHAGHPEVEGTSGRVRDPVILVSSVAEVAHIVVRDPEQLAYVTQTTLSVDDTKAIIAALHARFPAIEGPDVRDICYATQNRQNAVRDLAQKVDLVLVIGAANSSNSNRLCDLAQEMGVRAQLINGAADIQLAWLADCKAVGITAGASAPEVLVEGVISYLQSKFNCQVTQMEGVVENIKFKLPKILRDARENA